MNVTLNIGGTETATLTTEAIAALIADQAVMPVIGETDLFGETVTAAHMALSLRRLSETAAKYAAAIEAQS
jgi:hypothetical protein